MLHARHDAALQTWRLNQSSFSLSLAGSHHMLYGANDAERFPCTSSCY